MIDVALILTYQGLEPYSQEDKEALRELAGNVPVRAKITAVRNPRSYQQLKAYWACCRAVAENTENPDFNTKEKVDLQLRIKLGWVQETIIVSDRVQFVPKSISYKTMKHLEACRYFERAFETMAKFLKCSVEDLIKCAE